MMRWAPPAMPPRAGADLPVVAERMLVEQNYACLSPGGATTQQVKTYVYPEAAWPARRMRARKNCWTPPALSSNHGPAERRAIVFDPRGDRTFVGIRTLVGYGLMLTGRRSNL